MRSWKKKLIFILVFLVAAMSLTWASLWQQEMLFVDTFITGTAFNFMGFGTQGLQWWSWRDIFYLWILIADVLFVLTGYYVGKGRTKKRKRSEI